MCGPGLKAGQQGLAHQEAAAGLVLKVLMDWPSLLSLEKGSPVSIRPDSQEERQAMGGSAVQWEGLCLASKSFGISISFSME